MIFCDVMMCCDTLIVFWLCYFRHIFGFIKGRIYIPKTNGFDSSIFNEMFPANMYKLTPRMVSYVLPPIYSSTKYNETITLLLTKVYLLLLPTWDACKNVNQLHLITSMKVYSYPSSWERTNICWMLSMYTPTGKQTMVHPGSSLA